MFEDKHTRSVQQQKYLKYQKFIFKSAKFKWGKIVSSTPADISAQIFPLGVRAGFVKPTVTR